MNPELLRKKRWFRALEIAKCLFEDEGYHTEYLKDIEKVLKGENGMYSPKIEEDLVIKLYQKAKVLGVPMTKLVDQIIRKALNGKEPKREEKMSNNHNLVRPEEWELTCVRYKFRGEPKPLDVVDGVLVKDEKEQRSVEKHLKKLYKFPSEKDYQNFVASFIIKDNGRNPNG